MTILKEKDNAAETSAQLLNEVQSYTNNAYGEIRMDRIYDNTDQSVEAIQYTKEKVAASPLAPIRRKSSSPNDIPFDSNAPELVTTWSSYAKVICCVNTYPNGITVSLHEGPAAVEQVSANEDVASKKYRPNQFHLRFRDTRDYLLAPGKYFLYKKEALSALERHLSVLHHRGLLNETVLYFGTVADPFLAFHKKFDLTTGALELFGHYRASRVVVQTRSPMVIAALPMLKALAEKAVAVIPIESHLEKSIARYTPGKPKISERLVAAQGLRRQGVMVNVAVSPVLPYGDAYRNAWDFVELVERHADYVTFGCLAAGSETNEKQLKNLPVAQKLAADQQFQWLRPNAYKYLYQALKVIAPEKLRLPVKAPVKPSQLTLFAA